MGRRSPLGIEGTGVTFREPNEAGRMTVAQVRAKDEDGRRQARRFTVTSWRRDGSPVPPPEAIEWARKTRKAFVREEAVAAAATFLDFTGLLADRLTAEGCSAQRVTLVRAVGRCAAAEGFGGDMRRDSFPARLHGWIAGLRVGWSMAADAPNRRRTCPPLSPATRNKVLIIAKQATGLAVALRRLPFNPLTLVKPFPEPSTLKPLFTVAELRRMVSDEARDHAATERAALEAAIAKHGGGRVAAVKAIAAERECHWSSIYNALGRAPEPDPWHLACCLMVYTGCRAQEAMALRWEWIRWDARVIMLKLTDDYANKSDAERLIPLEPELAEILRPAAKPAGHILPPEIRAGGSGVKRFASAAQGKGAGDFTAALGRYLHRIGLDMQDRTAHSLRHCFITLKLARADMNVERLRKAVGHADFSTTMGYGKQSQLFEAEVDQWPDATLWLRRVLGSIGASQVAT
jgi:integrase